MITILSPRSDWKRPEELLSAILKSVVVIVMATTFGISLEASIVPYVIRVKWLGTAEKKTTEIVFWCRDKEEKNLVSIPPRKKSLQY